jgi:hypothetical protein
VKNTIQGRRRIQIVVIFTMGIFFALEISNQAVSAQPQRAAEPAISVSPSVLNFGPVNVGSASTIVVTLQNPSSSAVNITGVSSSLAEAAYVGPALPVTLNPGDTLQAPVSLTADAATLFRGSIEFTEDNGAVVLISLIGTGVSVPTPVVAPAQLALSSSNIGFGSVAVGATATQAVTVSNSGNSNLTLSGVSLAGPGFAASGLASGAILIPGQSSVLTVTFSPAATGSVTGSVTIGSDAASTTVALTGNGTASPSSETATLNWAVDDSATGGYDVYSSSTSGGPYTKLTATPIAATSYTDSSVEAGQTYYYVVTAVDANGVESDYSAEISAQIP